MHIKNQLTIARWNMKNYKWVYLFFCLLYIVMFPGIGLVLRLKGTAEQQELLYGYLIHTLRMAAYALGSLPCMMLLNSIRSGDGGECIRAERNWREGMQVFIQIIGYLLLISITMFLLLAEFCGVVGTARIIRDLINTLLVLWLLCTCGYLVTKLTGNGQASFLLIELYVLIFWFLGVGLDHSWNIFALETVEGVLWKGRCVCYGVAGAVMLCASCWIRKRNRRR